MAIGGGSRLVSLTGTYVSERALARGANIARSQWDDAATALRHHTAPNGETLVSATHGRRLLAQLMKGGQASADQVVSRVLTQDGAAWRRQGHSFVALSAPTQNAITGAAQIARPVVAAPIDDAHAASRFTSGRAPRVAALGTGTAAGIAGVVIAERVLHRRDGNVPARDSAAAGPADTTSAQRRAAAATLAEQQVGRADTTADGKLDPQVATYMSSSTGQAASRERDWAGDMVGWIWSEAGVTLGEGGEGAHDITSLVIWARDNDIWQDGAPVFDASNPDAELGKLLVLQGDHDRTIDVGVVVRADANELELVMGNRASGSGEDGTQVGVVRRVIVDRAEPLIAGLVDPTLLDSSTLAGPTSEPEPEPATEPEPSEPEPTEPEPTEPATGPAKPDKPHGTDDGPPTISPRALRRVAPWLSKKQAAELGDTLGRAFAKHDIDTPQRAAMAIAQMAHESGGFRTTQEYGTDAYFTKHYEGRSDLGNTQPGDGARFHGRGYIQLTGRANYKAMSKALDVDFVSDPDKVATKKYAALVSARWWKDHGLNRLADSGDFTAVTRRINGGTNGLESRRAYYERARKVAEDLVPS